MPKSSCQPLQKLRELLAVAQEQQQRTVPVWTAARLANLRAKQSKPNTKRNDDWQRYDDSTAGNESAMNN